MSCDGPQPHIYYTTIESSSKGVASSQFQSQSLGVDVRRTDQLSLLLGSHGNDFFSLIFSSVPKR